jgi:hypothetical protein
VVPKATRELTVPIAMMEGFIVDATSGANGRRTHFTVVK